MLRSLLSAVVAAGFIIMHAVGADAAREQSTPPGSQQAGSAKGTLTVGSSTFHLSHAYAFPDKPGETYRVLVTNQRLTAAAVKFAASAGASEEARQELVLELAEHKVHGLEMMLGADKRVTRVNVYSPDSAMGMMLLQPIQFQATAFDSKTIGGKLFTEQPIEDGRIGKTVAFQATFAAQLLGAAK